MCGEAGEAANVAKKLRRLEQGLRGNYDTDSFDSLRDKLGFECADTFLYDVLLAARYDIDLASYVVKAFNKKSEEQNFPERL